MRPAQHRFEYNTVIDSSGIKYGCVGEAFGPQGSYNAVHQDFNTYYTPNTTTLPFDACGKTFAALQAAGYTMLLFAWLPTALSVAQIQFFVHLGCWAGGKKSTVDSTVAALMVCRYEQGSTLSADLTVDQIIEMARALIM